jgi:peptide alpha-N-acetyltransferase
MLMKTSSFFKVPAMVALLRSLSSYAAAEWVGVASTMRQSDPAIYNIRLARRGDIAAIRDCNLRNLPENYSDEFFKRHLNTWPALSIVATKNDELIGYALGRAEITRDQAVSTTSSNSNKKVISYISPTPSYSGHVTSIAVHSQYRGLGVAKSLMQSLHTQMLAVHNINEVSLHCRVSNAAAIHLYSEFFAYSCASRVAKYYEDTEDAFLMKSLLLANDPLAKEEAPLFLLPNNRIHLNQQHE